jgi:hypothetical protein
MVQKRVCVFAATANITTITKPSKIIIIKESIAVKP